MSFFIVLGALSIGKKVRNLFDRAPIRVIEIEEAPPPVRRQNVCFADSTGGGEGEFMATSAVTQLRPWEIVTQWIREHQDPDPVFHRETAYFKSASGQLASVTQDRVFGMPAVLASFYDSKTGVATMWQLQGRAAFFGQFAKGQWEQSIAENRFDSFSIKFSHMGIDSGGDGAASWSLGVRSFCLGLPLPVILSDSAYLATDERGFTFPDVMEKNVRFAQKADYPQDVFDFVSRKSAEILTGGPWTRIRSAEFRDIVLHKRPKLEEETNPEGREIANPPIKI